jgi:glycosyltransferase involved in cell wall biosynthesis
MPASIDSAIPFVTRTSSTKMANISISVAMCTFNGARFLSAQLESIAAQDRPPDELVICDDGSSDETLELVRDFERRFKIRTCLVVNGTNLGSTRNFEQAIYLCQCQVVALADQDDVWYPHKLRRIEEAFLGSTEGRSAESPDGPVAVFSDADLIDTNDCPLDGRLWRAMRFTVAEQRSVQRGEAIGVLLKHPVVTGATMAFRRELFDLLTPLPSMEIHDRWISFLLATCGRVVGISEPLMQYRCHAGQQIGPGPLTMQQSITLASSRGADFYEEEITRYRRFAEKLKEGNGRFMQGEKASNEIKKKLSHLEHRATLPRPRFARISPMLHELVCGNYWRYSGGWRSLAKDFMLR